MTDPDVEAAAAGVLVMVENNVPLDVQELLIHGNPSIGVPVGVLSKVLRATVQSYLSHPVCRPGGKTAWRRPEGAQQITDECHRLIGRLYEKPAHKVRLQSGEVNLIKAALSHYADAHK